MKIPSFFSWNDFFTHLSGCTCMPLTLQEPRWKTKQMFLIRGRLWAQAICCILPFYEFVAFQNVVTNSEPMRRWSVCHVLTVLRAHLITVVHNLCQIVFWQTTWPAQKESTCGPFSAELPSKIDFRHWPFFLSLVLSRLLWIEINCHNSVLPGFSSEENFQVIVCNKPSTENTVRSGGIITWKGALLVCIYAIII